jgi:transaldolase
LAVPETAIVLSPSTLETYGEVSLLPMNLIGDLAGAEEILAILPMMKIFLDKIASQLVNEEIARSLIAFDQLLNSIEQKRSE